MRSQSLECALPGNPFVGFLFRQLRVILCIAINQNIAHIFALRRGGQDQARRNFRRQILQAVDGEVGLVLQQSHLEFLGKQPFRQATLGFCHRSLLQFVAGGLDDFQLEPQAWKIFAALFRNEVGLCKRKRAAARGDDDGTFDWHL